MQIDTVSIEYEGKKEDIRVKRLKLRARIAVNARAVASTPDPADQQAERSVQLIIASVVNGENQPFLTVDEIDEWSNAKFGAYSAAVAGVQTPKLEDTAKNSSTTATGETSSP